MWRSATGEQIWSRTASNKTCSALAFTPRGDTLATSWEGGTIRLFGVATGKELRRFQSSHVRLIETLAFAPDGKTLASGGSDSTVRLWSMATGKELLGSAGPQGPMYKVALSPNGRMLACGGADDYIYLCDINNTILTPLPGRGRWRVPLAFSSDSQALVAEGPDRTINVWDVATRTVRHRFRWKDAEWFPRALSPDGRLAALQEGRKTLHLMEVPTGKERCAIPGSPFEVAFSVDRQLLAWGNREGDVRLYGVATGREQRQFRWPLRQFDSLALSPDNQFLAVAELASNHYEIHVSRVATGEDLLGLRVGWNYPWALAFAPDGRTLAAGLDDHTISLWEVPSGGLRGVIRGHRGTVDSVVFSGDGRRLASSSRDTTALLWDLAALPGGRPRPAALTNSHLEKLWRELAGEDATVSYRAIWELAAFPQSACTFLESRLRPIPRVTPTHLAQLFADLDSTDFDVRQEARAALVKLEDAAEPALLQVARKPPSAEVGRQVKELLDRLRTARRATSGDYLRARRAVEALERMNSPEARQLLKKLADGAPAAGLTREAKASLLRMRPAKSSSP